jgi:hypothetical protein
MWFATTASWSGAAATRPVIVRMRCWVQNRPALLNAAASRQ